MTGLDDIWTVEEVLQTRFYNRTIREMMSQPPPIVTGNNHMVSHLNIPMFIRIGVQDAKRGNSIGVAYRTALVHGYSIIIHKHHTAILDIGRMWHTLIHAWHRDVVRVVEGTHFSCDGFGTADIERVSLRMSDKVFAAITDTLADRLRMTVSDAMNACFAASLTTADHVDENIEKCNVFLSTFDATVDQRQEYFRIQEIGLDGLMQLKNEAERDRRAMMKPDPRERLNVTDSD